MANFYLLNTLLLLELYHHYNPLEIRSNYISYKIMPAPISPELWQQHRQRIERYYYDQYLPLQQVIRIMKSKGFNASAPSYERQFKKWNKGREVPLKKKNPIWEDEKLVETVRILWHRNYHPKRMLQILNNKLGYPDLTKRQLQEIRIHHHLRLRHQIDPRAREKAVGEAGRFIIKTCGLSARWGAGYTHTWTRQHIDEFVSAKDVRRILRVVDRTGVEARRRDQRRHRIRYMVKGPNRVWSVDGHDKLAAYGFQIYGIIDAFSRMIIGVYIGISNRTQVAVLAFFLRCVRHHGIPKLVRSDKGMETLLMCVAQVALRRAFKPALPFKKAYTFGPSTKNQRIEAWWNTLANGLTESWKKFFEQLHYSDLFDPEVVYDIMALRYIYFEKVRRDVEDFAELHNINPIRSQRSRTDYHRSGVPEDLFLFQDDVRSYHTKPEGPAVDIIEQFESYVANFDLDVYQTAEVEVLCKELLRAGDITYDLEEIHAGIDESHVQAYNYLRHALREFETQSGKVLENLEPPRGGWRWIEAMEEAQRQQDEPTRRPEDIPDDEVVSEVEMCSGDEYGDGDGDDGSGSDNEGIFCDL